MQSNLSAFLHFVNLVRLSAFLPGVAVGCVAVAMALSHHRRHSAVVIGAFVLGGFGLGTVGGFLFLPTPEAAGHLAGAALLAGAILGSLWELVRRRKDARKEMEPDEHAPEEDGDAMR